MTDPFVGPVGLLPGLLGQLKPATSVYNVAKGRKERIGRLLKMHANKREEIRRSAPATSAPPSGLKTVVTGDTICDEKQPVMLESIEFPSR
jgi:elongation factor G